MRRRSTRTSLLLLRSQRRRVRSDSGVPRPFGHTRQISSLLTTSFPGSSCVPSYNGFTRTDLYVLATLSCNGRFCLPLVLACAPSLLCVSRRFFPRRRDSASATKR